MQAVHHAGVVVFYRSLARIDADVFEPVEQASQTDANFSTRKVDADAVVDAIAEAAVVADSAAIQIDARGMVVLLFIAVAGGQANMDRAALGNRSLPDHRVFAGPANSSGDRAVLADDFFGKLGNEVAVLVQARQNFRVADGSIQRVANAVRGGLISARVQCSAHRDDFLIAQPVAVAGLVVDHVAQQAVVGITAKPVYVFLDELAVFDQLHMRRHAAFFIQQRACDQ